MTKNVMNTSWVIKTFMSTFHIDIFSKSLPLRRINLSVSRTFKKTA